MRPLTLKVLLENNLISRDAGLGAEDHDAPAKRYRRPLLMQLAAAKKAGKPYAYAREGGVAGRDREIMARRAAEKLGVEFHPFNLEHPKTDIENDDSLTMKRLRRMTGSDAGARGIRQAFLGGQGDPRYRNKEGDEYLRSQGIDPDDQDAMYRASFDQEDFKAKTLNPINRGQQMINRDRRAGWRRTMDQQRKLGRHVGGLVGGDHIEGGLLPQPKRKWDRDPKYDA